MSDLLDHTCTLSSHYLEQVSHRPVLAQQPDDDLKRQLGRPLSADGDPDLTIIESLAHAGERATWPRRARATSAS